MRLQALAAEHPVRLGVLVTKLAPNSDGFTVQTSDAGQPYPMMHAQGMAMASSAPPVAVEAGTTDVTVTVSGEAVLDAPRAVAR